MSDTLERIGLLFTIDIGYIKAVKKMLASILASSYDLYSRPYICQAFDFIDGPYNKAGMHRHLDQ